MLILVQRVTIDVVHDWAWGNVTHQFIPMCKSSLIPKLFIHCGEVIKGFSLWTWVEIVASIYYILSSRLFNDYSMIMKLE